MRLRELLKAFVARSLLPGHELRRIRRLIGDDRNRHPQMEGEAAQMCAVAPQARPLSGNPVRTALARAQELPVNSSEAVCRRPADDLDDVLECIVAQMCDRHRSLLASARGVLRAQSRRLRAKLLVGTVSYPWYHDTR